MRFPRPFLGQSVRLRAEGFDDLVEVVAVDEDGSIVLAVTLTAEEAHLLYASAASAVHLTGAVAAEEEGPGRSRFTAADVETFQRREAYRVPMGVPATVRRGDGSELACKVADLSPGGALLSPEADGLLLGERVELVIHHDMLRELPLPAEVIRRDGARRALRFDALSVRADNALSRVITEAQLRHRRR